MKDLTISLVAYKNDLGELQQLVDSIKKIKIPYDFYVVDNSPDTSLQSFFEDQDILYHYANANLGFGAGHNIAIRKAINNGSKYHLLVNPDVYFDAGNVERMVDFIASKPEVGMVGPKIKWPDGKVQHNARRLPRPFDLFVRRFIPRKWMKKRLAMYEMQDMDYEKPFEAGYVSDSFVLYTTKALEEVGMYEEKFFLHMEEVDMSTRLKKINYKIYYFPLSEVVHGRRSEHRTSWRVFKIATKAAIIYFNKHGWRPLY